MCVSQIQPTIKSIHTKPQHKISKERFHMDYQLQLLAKFTHSVSLLNKFYGQDRPQPAAMFDHNSDGSSPYCAVCLDDVGGGDRYRKLPECGHCFHAHCIGLWLKSHSSCPLCRTQLPQIISLNENQYQWDAIIANAILLFRDFVDRMCNPLNHELASMLCDNIMI